MPESPCLPIELYELVIGNFDRRDDEPTLRACSLACRAFLPASRRSLFYHVDLIDRQHAENFLHIICSVPSPSSPRRHIHSLSLTEGLGGEILWLNEALPVLAECLLDVEILEIEFLMWNELDNLARTAILSGFLMVKTLEVMSSIFESSEQGQFIASFPSLMDLSCCDTHWEPEINGPPIAALRLPRGLRHITLDSDNAILFHRHLSRELHPSVRALTFRYVFQEDTAGVGMLLKTLGSSLEELDLGDLHNALGDKESDAEVVFSDAINLAHNSHLRSLCLKLFCYNFNPSPLTWAITLLSQITSLDMVRISLLFTLSDVSFLNTMDGTQLEILFNQQRWSNLEEVEFYWYGTSDITVKLAVRAFMKAHFPALESRNILRLSY